MWGGGGVIGRASIGNEDREGVCEWCRGCMGALRENVLRVTN